MNLPGIDVSEFWDVLQQRRFFVELNHMVNEPVPT
jgi:hypothetical protein